jgi:hypothetical protein
VYIGVRFEQEMYEMTLMELFYALPGKGRTRAIPQQTLQTCSVVASDFHRGIKREATAVLPAGDVERVYLV